MVRFVVRRNTAVAIFPVQTLLRASKLVDSRLAAGTTSLWSRQRSGDAKFTGFSVFRSSPVFPEPGKSEWQDVIATGGLGS